MKTLTLGLIFLGGLVAQAQNQWPQWRGPDRTDHSAETGLLKSWPEEGPKLLWTTNDAGFGYSGPAIVDGHMYNMGSFDGEERLMCFNADTGKKVWETKIGDLLENGWGDGPRSTPTVNDGHVYAVSGQGNLTCADAKTGDIIWTQAYKDLGGKVPNWGYTESPLVKGKLVFATPGGKEGAMRAFDKKTGKQVWACTEVTDPAHYSSPIFATHNGTAQIIQLFMSKLIGVDAGSGKLLWSSDWDGRTAVIPTPIFHDGQVFITTGYGVGCKLVDIGDNAPKDVYKNKNMKNHHGGVILLDGHVYGYSDGFGWTCLNFDSGEIVWSEKKALGKGAIAYADGHFYCLDEKSGEVVLLKATTKKYSEKGRFTLDPQTENRKPKGRIWVHPVIVNGKLYLRDQEILHCYDVSAK